MVETYTGSLSEFFGGGNETSTGTALTTSPRKKYTGSLSSFFDGETDNKDDIFSSTLSSNDKLKLDDFYERKNLNVIREYMTRNKGEDYRTMEDDNELVNDFVDHMRWFNTNTLSTAGEVQFVRKGSEADKAAAADAYRLYDSLGNLFTRGETISGQIDGIKDYIFAAAADPSNYLGLFTGGLGKAATLGVTTASKKAIKEVTKKAYKDGCWIYRRKSINRRI